MAATYRAVSTAIAFASAKSMLDVFNDDAAVIARVYRAFLFNNQTSAVTGVLTTMKINRLTTAPPTGGSLVTPVKHDTGAAALDADVTAGTGRTPSRSDNFRTFLWSNDEPSVSANTLDEWELLVPFAQVWEAGYGDSNVEPIVCRENFGFEIQQSGSSAVGVADAEIEFTAA